MSRAQQHPVGIAMEYVIPMMGYTIWVSSIAVFLLFSIEAVAGASFWAFAHIRADGQDLVNQEQSYGWKILPVAILYPAMMVVGLVLANVAISAILSFVNSTYLLATNTIGAVYDPFGLAAVLSVLFGIYYNAIQRSYRLITWIPEWVMSWMGGQGLNRGDGHGEGIQIMERSRQGAGSSLNTAAGRMQQNMAGVRKQNMGIGMPQQQGPGNSATPQSGGNDQGEGGGGE